MSVNYGEKYSTARGRIFMVLSDLEWHGHKELEAQGGNRYTARILELRRLGFVIETQTERAEGEGKRWRLTSLAPGAAQPKRVKAFLDEADAAALIAGVLTDRAREALADALASFRANKGKL